MCGVHVGEQIARSQVSLCGCSRDGSPSLSLGARGSRWQQSRGTRWLPCGHHPRLYLGWALGAASSLAPCLLPPRLMPASLQGQIHLPQPPCLPGHGQPPWLHFVERIKFQPLGLTFKALCPSCFTTSGSLPTSPCTRSKCSSGSPSAPCSPLPPPLAPAIPLGNTCPSPFVYLTNIY